MKKGVGFHWGLIERVFAAESAERASRWGSILVTRNGRERPAHLTRRAMLLTL